MWQIFIPTYIGRLKNSIIFAKIFIPWLSQVVQRRSCDWHKRSPASCSCLLPPQRARPRNWCWTAGRCRSQPTSPPPGWSRAPPDIPSTGGFDEPGNFDPDFRTARCCRTLSSCWEPPSCPGTIRRPLLVGRAGWTLWWDRHGAILMWPNFV